MAIQVFDQKKFKKKDQGFLGVINIRVGDILEMGVDGDGTCLELLTSNANATIANSFGQHRCDDHARS